MKKFISLFLSCFLLMSCIFVPTYAADECGLVSVGTVSATTGSEVTVSVSLSANPGIVCFQFLVSYDSSVMELTSATGGSFSNTAFGPLTNNPFAISWTDAINPNNKTTGSVASLTFKIKDGAAPGTYPITVSYDPDNVYNSNWDNVHFDVSNGSVTIACSHKNTENSPAVEATCNSVGYTAGVYCNDCKTYISGHEEISKNNNHKYGAWEKNDANTHKQICSVCKGINTEAHHWGGGVVTKPATHFEKGVLTYTCEICGETKTSDISELTAHEFGAWEKYDENQHVKNCACGHSEYAAHTWNNGVVTTPATHLATGVKTYTCGVCGETKTEIIGKTPDHSFGEWKKVDENNHERECACGEKETKAHTWNGGVVTKPASHVEEGVTTYTCTACDATKTEAIAKTNDHGYGAWEKHNAEQHKKSCACGDVQYAAHTWNNGVVTTPATHLATGVKTYTCGDCGETKTEIIGKTPDHSFGEWKKVDANNHERECACGEKETKAHIWNDGVVTKPATCKETGVMTYNCIECNAKKTETIPVSTNHTYGDWTKVDDNTHKHICTVCDKAETAEHKWNAGVVTKPATCKETGVKTYTCTDCNATKTETIPVSTTHSYGACTKVDDNTHKHTCTVCGKTETVAHTWDSGKVTKAATCTTAGVKTYTCTGCSVTKTEVIPANGNHSYGSWKAGGDSHTRTCTSCGKTDTQLHSFDEGKVTTAPTHTEEGVKTYSCKVCSATKKEAIAKTTEHSFGAWENHNDTQHKKVCACTETEYADHTWDSGKVTKAATCKETGVMTYTCTVCGGTKTEEIAKLTSHTFGEWTYANGTHERVCACGEKETAACTFDGGKITTAPTETAEGVKTFTCTVCGGTKTETLAKLNKINVTVPEENFGGADIGGSSDDIRDAVLTDEENEMAINGVSIEVKFEVKDIDESVTENDRELIDNACDGKYEVGKYLDIKLSKTVGDEISFVKTTDGLISVTIVVPAELIAEGRIYRVVRIHDGQTEILDGVFDAATGEFTFETDRFSTYALVYETASANNSFVWIAIAGVAALAVIGAVIGIVVSKKKKA